MASSGVSSVAGGTLGDIIAPRGSARVGGALAAEILGGSSRSGVQGRGAEGQRRQLVNVEGSEMNMKAPRGTYLDILV